MDQFEPIDTETNSFQQLLVKETVKEQEKVTEETEGTSAAGQETQTPKSRAGQAQKCSKSRELFRNEDLISSRTCAHASMSTADT